MLGTESLCCVAPEVQIGILTIFLSAENTVVVF